MKEFEFQGFPSTVIKGNAVCVGLRFRDPEWMGRRKKLWKVGNLVMVGYATYQYLTGHIHQFEPAAFMLGAGSVAWWAFLNLICWRSRHLCFTPEYITFHKGHSLFHKTYDRMYPHGFRVQPYGQNGGYHAFMDHLAETVWLGDIYGHKAAELITRRLINVSEWMSQKFPNREVEEVDKSTRQRRSTFARGG